MFHHIQYRFVMIMSAWGAIIGTAEVMGFFPDYLFLAYLFSWVFTALAGARALKAGWFVNGTVIGFFVPLVAALLKVLLYDTYTENNLQYIQSLEQKLSGTGVKSFILSLSLITAVGNALIQGFICMSAGKFAGKK